MLEYSLGKYNLCESRAVVADRDFLSPCGACPHSGNESNVLNMPQKLMPDFTAVGFCSPFLARQPRGAEIRNPKSENRRKSEIREPPSQVAGRLHGPRKSEGRAGGWTFSVFGNGPPSSSRLPVFPPSLFVTVRFSDFGFQPSPTSFPATVPDIAWATGPESS